MTAQWSTFLDQNCVPDFRFIRLIVNLVLHAATNELLIDRVHDTSFNLNDDGLLHAVAYNDALASLAVTSGLVLCAHDSTALIPLPSEQFPAHG